jgi:hypothetical protein
MFLWRRSSWISRKSLPNAVAAATKAFDKKGGASNSQVIVDLILKTVRARKPKTRYVAGKYAKPLMFMRKWFGDRAFDRIVLATVK